MTDDRWPTRDADEARFADLCVELVGAVDTAIGPWVQRSVEQTATRLQGVVPGPLRDAATAAAAEARATVTPAMRSALLVDLDDQAANPLHIVRAAVRYPTQVLADAGVPTPGRDRVSVEQFPDDVYDLSPATWADLDPALHDLGLAWGAAKAFVFRGRRRLEGFE